MPGLQLTAARLWAVAPQPVADAYWTLTNDYIESVWWILKNFWEKDLLFKGYKVVPYCPRCGTPLPPRDTRSARQRASAWAA